MKIFAVGKPKKGSLSLSLNAIVVLILAIAMLGLGLAFLRGVFKQMTERVKTAVQIGDLQNPPAEDKPMTVTPQTVETKKGQTAQFDIAFMNAQPDVASVQMTLVECRTGGDATIPTALYGTGSYDMPKGSINVWTIAVPTDPVTKDTYLCTATVQSTVGLDPPSSYSRDFIIITTD